MQKTNNAVAIRVSFQQNIFKLPEIRFIGHTSHKQSREWTLLLRRFRRLQNWMQSWLKSLPHRHCQFSLLYVHVHKLYSHGALLAEGKYRKISHFCRNVYFRVTICSSDKEGLYYTSLIIPKFGYCSSYKSWSLTTFKLFQSTWHISSTHSISKSVTVIAKSSV